MTQFELVSRTPDIDEPGINEVKLFDGVRLEYRVSARIPTRSDDLRVIRFVWSRDEQVR